MTASSPAGAHPCAWPEVTARINAIAESRPAATPNHERLRTRPRVENAKSRRRRNVAGSSNSFIGDAGPPSGVAEGTVGLPKRVDQPLLEFDRGASFFEGLLGLLRVFLRGLLQHRLGCVVDKILGFFEAE